MLVLKYAFVSLSLGATLVAPSVAMACNTAHDAGQTKTVNSNHDKDDKKTDKDVKPKSDSDKVKSDKDDKVKSDKDDKAKSDKDDKKKDKDNSGKGKDCAPTPTPTPEVTPTPTPEATPTPGAGASDNNGQVLSSATTPVTQAAAPTTLPVTGSSDSLVFVIAGGSALGAYLLMKRGGIA